MDCREKGPLEWRQDCCFQLEVSLNMHADTEGRKLILPWNSSDMRSLESVKQLVCWCCMWYILYGLPPSSTVCGGEAFCSPGGHV